MVDIVSLGEPLYEFSQIPGEGRRYLQGFGGDTTNCAVAAARQGANVAYITRVGDDEFGRQFLDLWRDEGVDACCVKIDSAGHTAVYFITHGQHGHVFSYLRAGSAASRMTLADLDGKLIAGAKFFHTSGITQAISASACDTSFAAIDIARRTGVQVVYDANYRPRLWPAERAAAIARATIANSDIFLLSSEDAAALAGLTETDTILRWCHDMGAKTAVLKLGAEGAIASVNGERFRVAGHRVECVDATGAGDCFAGALMARLCLGDDFRQALAYANAAAALTTTGYGAIAPLPRPEVVFNVLRRREPEETDKS